MTTFVQFLVLGLGVSAIYALLSQGLIVIYSGSGVLNFAHAAMATLGAYLYWEGRNTGDLLGIVSVSDGDLGFWPSFASAVLAVTAIGVLVHHLVMRPLKDASQLAKAIASLGVLILIQGVIALKWAEVPRNVNAIFPADVYEVGDVIIPADRIYMAVIAVALTAALWAMYRFTAIGLAIRASAENQRAAATLGWSPNTLATITWALGSGLAGVAGVIIAPISGINPEEMPLFILPVLAAALIGGFTSFWITLAAAFAIGITQSEFTQYLTQSWAWGFRTAFPFVVIILLLLIRGTGLPMRGQVVERLAALGSGIVRWRWLTAIVVGYILAQLFWFDLSLQAALTVSLAFAIVMLSLVVLLGYTGQLSLAQFALAGLAALISARLVDERGWPFEVAFLVAVLATIPIGLLFAVPALRTRGINLAVVTLGLAMSVNAVIFTNPRRVGPSGFTDVGPQTFLGIDIDTGTADGARRYGLLVFGVFLLCALSVASIRRGVVGRRMIAVRTNERAAAALGISVFGVKLYAFSLAAALAAIGGVLYAFRNTTVTYTDFVPLQSILAAAYTVIGGIGFVLGAPFGSQLVEGGFGTWLLDVFFDNPNPSWLIVIGGITVIALIVLHPDGAISVNAELLNKLGGWLSRRLHLRPKAPPEPPAAVEREPVTHAVLEAKGVTVRFGGVVAVNDASVEVRPGEVVGLIGPNGAGKTTLIDAITGFVRPAQGEITLNGEPIGSWPVYRRTRAGVSRSFQQLELFESSTVRENLMVASDGYSVVPYVTDLVRPTNPPLSATALAAVKALELERHLDQRVSDLPYGRRRLVAIARAVAVAPSILLLDEPAAGLSATETSELATVVRRLAQEWELGILVIEHDMSFVMSVCDRITVLDFGRQIATGSPAEIRSDPAVIAAYLGEEEADVEPAEVTASPGGAS